MRELISVYEIKPRLSEDGQISLATDEPADPVTGLILMALDVLQSGFLRRFKLCNEPTCRAS